MDIATSLATCVDAVFRPVGIFAHEVLPQDAPLPCAYRVTSSTGKRCEVAASVKTASGGVAISRRAISVTDQEGGRVAMSVSAAGHIGTDGRDAVEQAEPIQKLESAIDRGRFGDVSVGMETADHVLHVNQHLQLGGPSHPGLSLM